MSPVFKKITSFYNCYREVPEGYCQREVQNTGNMKKMRLLKNIITGILLAAAVMLANTPAWSFPGVHEVRADGGKDKSEEDGDFFIYLGEMSWSSTPEEAVYILGGSLRKEKSKNYSFDHFTATDIKGTVFGVVGFTNEGELGHLWYGLDLLPSAYFFLPSKSIGKVYKETISGMGGEEEGNGSVVFSNADEMRNVLEKQSGLTPDGKKAVSSSLPDWEQYRDFCGYKDSDGWAFLKEAFGWIEDSRYFYSVMYGDNKEYQDGVLFITCLDLTLTDRVARASFSAG